MSLESMCVDACDAVYCNHIVSILGPLRTLELHCLRPDRIIYRTYSAKENSCNEFMKCSRYILIVKAQEFSLEVSMGRLFEGRANLAISVGDTPPADCIQSRKNAMRVIS